MQLQVRDLSHAVSSSTGTTPLFQNVHFSLSYPPHSKPNTGTTPTTATPKDTHVLAIRGPSGSGKTTLLKCLCQLVDTGDTSSKAILLDGKSPREYGAPEWRRRVLYVPQRMPLLPGTPGQFLQRLQGFGAQGKKDVEGVNVETDPSAIALEWNVSSSLWNKEWSMLSGGETQRISLAIALSRHPDVLLLDEPTSALDPDTTLLVEQTLAKRRGMTVWITHDPAQERRVAGQTLDMALFAPNRGINKPDSVVVRVADADDTATDIECVA